ncbi:glycoside hydrolase family 95 protein [Tricholoma matsutake]|nr:glycoside hydrolase family 95 protein [Tricholoma matsutake 945]
MKHILLAFSDFLGVSLPRCTLCHSVELWTARVLLAASHLLPLTVSAPSGFPSSGNGLWFTKSAHSWVREWLPVGNGYLAESLWSGGPFADPVRLSQYNLPSIYPILCQSYNGGNKQPSEQFSTAEAMKNIRQAIFQSSTGKIDNIEALGTEPGAYGSYAGAGHLISNISLQGTVSNYARWLDLDQGIARTSWSQSGTTYLRSTFCSHPTQSCTQHITSTSSAAGLPSMSYAFSSSMEEGLPTPNITCLDSSTLRIRGFVSTPGMLYELLARVYTTPFVSGSSSATRCIRIPVAPGTPPNATIEVSGRSVSEAWISWVGETEYSLEAGDPAHGFSFRGSDPHDALLALLNQPTPVLTFSEILEQHVKDYKATLMDKFSLSLGQKPRLDVPTDVVKAGYKVDAGDTYLEWLMFNYGRYLLASSARGSLPANLQGKWANLHVNPWGADSNINIQMNYWSAEMTNLDVTQSLFDYFQKTWAPRGAFTAQVLYNISRGWVTHNEIFGHTGMKGVVNTAQWANYPGWYTNMIHVWDHFDHTNDVAWWKAQGWPLLKGAASFHLDKLILDSHFNDSTLVVNPCNSPEQPPITFGCAHSQQLIWQMFNAVEKGFAASDDTDTAFLEEVKAKRAQMDMGLRVGSWGQLQEWKVDTDSPTDTHRHLSHLIGLYPGYALATYDEATQGGLTVNGSYITYTKKQLLDAATVSLLHRGNGRGPDADAGWEKAWRAAAWAQLGNAEKFYHELSYGIFVNFGLNLFSLYDVGNPDPIFQIDANLAYPGVLLNALIQAPDVANFNIPLSITLLPALPKQWPSGSIKGARIRGGITLDLRWDNGKPESVALKLDAIIIPRPVQVLYAGKVVSSFTTSSGMGRSINSF